jgi:prolyl-tRNA editing enzyme YbaK/EbsC (Cys-tRNA(Pro) deacylase)
MTTPIQTPAHLQATIDELGIQARLINDIGPTPTVPAAAEALGVEAEQIIKTLLFLIELPGAAERTIQPVVVISNGESRVDKRPLADFFGVGKKRVKLASAETVIELLGYPAGGVPPIGHRTKLPVIVDAAVLATAERTNKPLYAGGGDDRTMMEIRVEELQAVTQGIVMAVS